MQIFKGRISRASAVSGSRATVPKTTEIHAVTHGTPSCAGAGHGTASADCTRSRAVIEEDKVRLRTTIVDTPGFGDQVNNENWCAPCDVANAVPRALAAALNRVHPCSWHPIKAHIENRYEQYWREETAVDRKAVISDSRIHACLYFIAPSGHSLKELDVQAMKALAKCVNVIPLIAKADSLTDEERVHFKARVRRLCVRAGRRVANDVALCRSRRTWSITKSTCIHSTPWTLMMTWMC